jgi:predicted acylesterase/phospholipase RssA
MKTALAISGGGSKGAFAVGAIDLLCEYGYQFDIVSGTSTGALIAPLVAVGDIEDLVDLYSNVSDKDIIRLNWRKFFWNAFYDTTPLKNLVTKGISEKNRYVRLMNSSCDVLLCSVCLQTQKTVYFSQRKNFPGALTWCNQEEFVQAVLASTNQPVFMDLPTINNMQYTDGGIREVVPLDILCRDDIGEIIVILNSCDGDSIGTEQFSRIDQIGLRTLDVMGTEIRSNDIQKALQCNDMLHFMEKARRRASDYLSPYQLNQIFAGWHQFGRPKKITIIRPDHSLGFSGLSFKPELMRRAIEVGRETARRILNA